MADKQDFLGECNTQKVTLEDFRQQFCIRCLNPECIRSQAGSSKFEQRVITWEDRLFKQVPKMHIQDPRYEKIRAQKFRMVDTGAPLEVGGSWVDPLDLDEGTSPPEPAEPPTPVPTPPPTPAPTPKLKSAGLVNTPSIPKRMIAGAPVSPTTVSKVTPDPWAPKQKSAGEKIVAPGARVRFGSGVSKG